MLKRPGLGTPSYRSHTQAHRRREGRHEVPAIRKDMVNKYNR
jgi:hypothetical protein